MIMTILLIISLVVIAITAGYLFKEPLSDMLPFVWCALAMVLYALAFINELDSIRYILPICAVALVIPLLIRMQRKSAINTENSLRSYIKGNITSIPVLTYLLLVIVVCFLISSRVATWWDDINFWMPDLKGLYYLNGFASKYNNVSPAFGDYPPAVQLVRWFVTYLWTGSFNEGAAYVGYYLFNFSFLIPIYKSIDSRKKWMAIPLVVITWLFPGMADKYGYAGSCMDLSMGFIFGGILIAAFDNDYSKRPFDDARVMLYAATLTLTKSTGAMWAAFGIIIWFVVKYDNVTSDIRHHILRCIKIVIAPFVAGASWMAFCLFNRRVTNTTATMVTYATSNRYGLSDYKEEFADAFIRAFIFEPLHVDRTWVYLSPLMMLIALTALLFLLYKKEYLPKREGRFVLYVLPLVGIGYYALIFLAHLTIFATETQYLEATAMIASIERYGVPFMLGTMMLTVWALLNAKSEKTFINSLIVCVAVIILSNIPAAYDGAIGYRNKLAEEIRLRDSFIDDYDQNFLKELETYFPAGNARVCRLRNGEYTRVDDAYVALEASPVSVIGLSYDLNLMDMGTLIQQIAQTHASYLYVDPQDGNDGSLPYIKESVSEGQFEFETLYHISYEDGGIVLYKCIK